MPTKNESGLRLIDALQSWLPDEEWNSLWINGQLREFSPAWVTFRSMLQEGTVTASGAKKSDPDKIVEIEPQLWDHMEPVARYIHSESPSSYWQEFSIESQQRLLTETEKRLEEPADDEWRRELIDTRESTIAKLQELKACPDRFTVKRSSAGTEEVEIRFHARKLGDPIRDEESEGVFRNPPTGAEVYGVRFSRLAVAQSDESPPTDVDPYRSGAPGRPTAAHKLREEFDKRKREGKLEESLAAQGRALCSWLKKEHPNAPKMTGRSIENVIREQWNTRMK